MYVSNYLFFACVCFFFDVAKVIKGIAARLNRMLILEYHLEDQFRIYLLIAH